MKNVFGQAADSSEHFFTVPYDGGGDAGSGHEKRHCVFAMPL